MLQKLYILPFDHRTSFIKMFGFSEQNLTEEQTAILADYKHIVYEGFLSALKMGVPKDAAAILVDEQFGAKIQEEAKDLGVKRILTVEKSGQEEFDFEYGQDFGAHIEKFKPDFVKVLVQYNPAGDKELNLRQVAKLKAVNDFCREKGYRFLFELLAVPTEEQLKSCGHDKEKYEMTLQGQVIEAAIQELQDNGIEPDIWKLEGLASLNAMRQVVEQAQSGARQEVGVVVLGRGESDAKVRSWLTTAAKIPGVVGFAVGRTVFKQALSDYQQGIIKREAAAQAIARDYKSLVDLFEKVKK